MAFLFFALVLVSIVGLVIGLTKPTRVKMKSRKQVSWIFGGGIVLFLILQTITTPQNQSTMAINPVNKLMAGTQTTSTSGTPQATEPKTGVEKACDPSKDPSLFYDATQMSSCVSLYDHLIEVDEAAGMTPAQAEASANGESTSTVQTTASQKVPPVEAPAPTPAPDISSQDQSLQPSPEKVFFNGWTTDVSPFLGSALEDVGSAGTDYQSGDYATALSDAQSAQDAISQASAGFQALQPAPADIAYISSLEAKTINSLSKSITLYIQGIRTNNGGAITESGAYVEQATSYMEQAGTAVDQWNAQNQ